MKGDFSNLTYRADHNFIGVLHQQGRVSLDQDPNAADLIGRRLRQLLGRDAIGPGAVAVPTEARESLEVVSATADGAAVTVDLKAGRAWVDGLPLVIPGEDTVSREARYFGPPIQEPVPEVARIESGVRDALVLEVWEETVNGFQLPDALLEPALGGVDTTERVRLCHALRLLRLNDGEDCGNIGGRLRDDPEDKGRLTVTPSPAMTVSGDCPVDVGGGYTGFEHYWWRIEVARPDGEGNARFKWSRFGGGLVGRGTYDETASEVAVTANDQMINHCGLTRFYLEALAHNPQTDCWDVAFAARAHLVEDGTLSLSDIETNLPGWPPSTADDNSVFIRLWDDIALISEYPTGLAEPKEPVEGLGLRVEFDDPSAGGRHYKPGDYWTFPVRAAGVDFDPAEWPDAAPPQGIRYYRAPLAVLAWQGEAETSVTAPDSIHDCRDVFRPLTRQDDCCTYTVGDGVESHGDFDSIDTAINHLPEAGGRICVLPGVYRQAVTIRQRRDITIQGCGARSLLQYDPGEPDGPLVRVTGSTGISIESLGLYSAWNAPGVLVAPDEQGLGCRRITLRRLEVRAFGHSAIDVRGARWVTVAECKLAMGDTPGPWPGLFCLADDVLIERNTVSVAREKSGFALETGARDFLSDIRPHARPSTAIQPDQPPLSAEFDVPDTGGTFGGEPSPEGADAPGDTWGNLPLAHAGRGGIQIGGTSERVRIVDNLIRAGIGNGITLGSLVEVDTVDVVTLKYVSWVVNADDDCDPCEPGDYYIPPTPDRPEAEIPRYRSAGALYDIVIENNRIFDMGLSGIGVVAFFNLAEEDELISVAGLAIRSNVIRGCLRRPIAAIPADMQDSMGYGAVALADVEDLLIHDNEILDNGFDPRDPVSGVYVLHGEGIHIARNHIMNTGSKKGGPVDNADNGPRAGVYIQFAVVPTRLTPILILKKSLPRQDGLPALSMHDNVVSQPLGRALAVTALGPVSVHGNQLSSRGALPYGSASFRATTVSIFNMGISNELYLKSLRFIGLRGSFNEDNAGKGAKIGEDGFILHDSSGLDDAEFGRSLVNGNVLFNDNQCRLDVVEKGITFAMSSILILSLDDVSFQGNQSDCDLLGDVMFFNTMTVGLSLRMEGNRFKETLRRALWSVFTLGLFFNTTAENQATHCFYVVPFGPSERFHKYANTVLLAGRCKRSENAEKDLSQDYPGHGHFRLKEIFG